MFLTFLSRLMSSAVTTLLFVTVVGLTASQTLLNTGYIETKLQSQNAYSRLSDALSTKISQDSNDPNVSQDAVASQLKTVLTPAVLQQKIDTTLKQLDAYYKGNGPVPTLDISDVVQQAQNSGLDIKADKFNKPITLKATTKGKKVSDTAKLVSIGTLVAVGVLLLGILGIAIKRKNYKPFANILFSLGLMLTITGTSLLFVPRIFNKMIGTSLDKNPFGPLAHDLAVSVVHDFGLRLLIPGVTALLLGTLAKIALRGTGNKQPKAKKSDGALALGYARATDAPAPDDTPPAEETPETPAPANPQPQQPVSTPGAPPRPKKPRKIQL